MPENSLAARIKQIRLQLNSSFTPIKEKKKLREKLNRLSNELDKEKVAAREPKRKLLVYR